MTEPRSSTVVLDRPAGLIFDLDGTLVDTVRARIDGWVEALAAAGLATPAATIGPMIGMDGKRLAREVATRAGRDLSEDETEAIDHAAGEAFDRRNRDPKPLSGLRRRYSIRLVSTWVSSTIMAKSSADIVAMPPSGWRSSR